MPKISPVGFLDEVKVMNGDPRCSLCRIAELSNLKDDFLSLKAICQFMEVLS